MQSQTISNEFLSAILRTMFQEILVSYQDSQSLGYYQRKI